MSDLAADLTFTYIGRHATIEDAEREAERRGLVLVALERAPDGSVQGIARVDDGGEVLG